MKLICANFKMNLLKNDILNYLDTIKNKNLENVVFFPNYLHIASFKNKGYIVGSQDISHIEMGAMTGDTSILQLKDMGISYTLIGHSERRINKEEKHIYEKLFLAIKNNITPILCIGESEDEYNQNLTNSILKREIDEALKNQDKLNNLIIAYEPIWSIGTGKIPTNEEIENIITFIKDYIFKNYQLSPLVLYGGSVNLDNIEYLENIKNLDGYLIGGASLDPKKLLEIQEKIKS